MRIKFLLTSLIIFTPLLTAGYVFSFDMAWGIHYPGVHVSNNTFIFTKLLETMSVFIGGFAVQKITLFGSIFLSLLGAYKFLKSMNDDSTHNLFLIASFFYILNPFFYTRYVNGQWLVLLGYALLPWAVRSLYIFLKDPRWRTAWPVAIWTVLIAMTSIHTVGIVALAGIGLLVWSGRERWKDKLKWGFAIAGIWLAANAIWIVPFVLGQSQNAQAVASFSHSEMEAFATKGTIAGSVPLSAALLTGFWADDQNRYILPSTYPIFWVGVAILFGIIVLGIVLVIKRKDRLGITFLVLGFIAWVLGMGIAWPPSAVVTEALIKIIPVYNGYREPQKWLILLALVYVYFLAIGATRLFDFIKHRYKQGTKYDLAQYALITVLIIAPFLYTPTLAWGAAGQLKSVDYPKGWYEAKDYLNAHAGKDAKVLVFPWHVYQPLSWVGRVVANPAPYFFDQTMIVSDDPEINGVPARGTLPVQPYVSNYIIPNITILTDAGSKLKPYDIRYVLLEKEADYDRYVPFLQRQTDLTRVYDNKNISIYKVAQ